MCEDECSCEGTKRAWVASERAWRGECIFPAMPAHLGDAARIGPVTLAVVNAERAMGFYRDLAGLRELSRGSSRVTLGAGREPVLTLVEEAGVKPAPVRASGLFHTAFLYPDRAALARVVKHISSTGYPFTGASDHLVSEAFYLDDPDGNGVELYRDRPRAEWKWNGDVIEMATLPLDTADLFSAADRDFDGAAEGTRVGHVHLKVNGIAEAEAFYRDVIGFAVTARFGDSATFLAAGGYHHHLGANIWQSRGAPAAGPGFAGLRQIVLQVPAAADVDGIVKRAKTAGVRARRESGEVVLQDPWGHRILLEISPPRP